MPSKNIKNVHNKIPLVRIFIFILLLLLSLFLITYLGFFNSRIESLLERAENDHISDEAEVILASLNFAMLNQHDQTKAWSSWDDCYNYTEGKNPQFAPINLENGIYISYYNVDFALIQAEDGRVVYEASRCALGNETERPKYPDGLTEALTPITKKVVESNKNGLKAANIDQPYCDAGFIVLDGVSYLITSLPVLYNGDFGEPKYAFTFVKKYDDAQFKKLTGLKNADFAIIEGTDKIKQSMKEIEIIDKNKIAVNVKVLNLGNNRNATLEIFQPRELYNNGINALKISLTIIMLITVLLLLVFFLVFFRSLIMPLRKLSADLTGIGQTKRLDITHYGIGMEFHILSTGINDMLERLETSYKDVEKSKVSINVLENILNGMDAYLYVSDTETDEILFINDKMKNHFKIEDNPVGKACWSVLQSNSDKRCSFCPLNKLLENPNRTVVWEEYNNTTKRYYKNTEILINWIDKKAHLQHRVDITDFRLMEQELIRAKDLAEQGSKAKSTFLSRMSHEIRTPMNAIIGMASLAKKADSIARKDYCLTKIDIASVHLLGVINDVLDMSKIEAGKLELSLAEFALEKMLMKITNVVNYRMEEKEQLFTIKIDQNVPHSIVSDEQRLSQVITNLLTNASKFTPENGSISLLVRRLDNDTDFCSLEFEVSDTGIGISKEQQQKLFQPFEQADGTISRKFGGTGLGLVISKNIVEMLGGSIRIESVVDKGSSFIFTIRSEIGRLIPEVDCINEYFTPLQQSETSIASADNTNRFRGKRILLAEDIDINREIVISMLEHTEIQIDCAEDGGAAYRMFKNYPEYDLIFMDVHMPEVNGYEATQMIRNLGHPRAKTVPIIAMTANVFKEDIEKCLASGMNGHVGKPLDFDAVVNTLEQYIYVTR